MSNENKKMDIKCASMIGDLAYLGKHIYFADSGVTLCGCFTVDYDRERFKEMPEGITSEYKVEEWDITCERCLNMSDMFSQINESKKAEKN